MNITTVVFDIDGTMLDTEAAVTLALQETMEELLGTSLSLAELRFTFSMAAKTALRVLGFPDIESAYRVWGKNCRRYLGKVCLFDGIPELVEELSRRGYRLGIVSSETASEYRMVFEPLGLSQYFDTVVLADDTTEHKPNAEPMRCYLARAGANPSEVLYLGDSVGDMICAEEAGVTGALACWCSTPADYPAPYRLERPGQLLDLLEQLGAPQKTADIHS